MPMVRGARLRLAAGSIAAGVALALGGAAVAAADESVSIVDFSFRPASVAVSAGDTVTWRNTGDQAHTVTADDGAFDIESLAPGESASLSFSSEGAFGYHCEIHPAMTGTVQVAAAGGAGGRQPSTDTLGAPVAGSGPREAGLRLGTLIMALGAAMMLHGAVRRRA